MTPFDPDRLDLRDPGLIRKNATDVDACLATRVLSHAFRAEHPDEVDRIRMLARVRPTTRANIARMLVAAARHDARSSLARIAAPTLVLVGARDPLPTGASQAELLTTIPNVQRAVIAEAGHDLSAESPVITAEHVLTFLDQ
jgi:3-oxoadipate enol-lactonase